MENLLISFNVVAPVFLLMLLGYFLKRIRLLTPQTKKAMDKVCFRAFFPVLLFNSIYKTDIKTSFNPKLLLFAVGSLVLLFVLLCLIIPLFIKEPERRGVMIQGIFRSNFVIFGLPISISLCGAENVGATSILIAVIVPLYNALSVVALEINSGSRVNVPKILKSVVTNPFIIGGAAGVLALLIHLSLPTPLEKTVSDIAGIATPLALILLGASFEFSELKGSGKYITAAVLSKLIVIPAIFITVSVLMGFRGAELAALTVMICAPTAVSTYTMAGEMNGDQKLAGQLVVFTSLCAVVTMFLFIFTLKQLALF